MKERIYSLILVSISICATVFLCSGCGDKQKKGNASPPELNITVYLDLSDRLVHNGLTPDQTYRDSVIIGHLVDYFVEHTKGIQLLKSKNKMKILFYPTPKDLKVSDLAAQLNVDIDKKQGIDKRLTLDSMRNTFSRNLSQIYEETIQQKNWVGSDIWGFFSDKKVDKLCIDKGARNIIVILTDGYIYDLFHKVKQEHAYSYITPLTLQDSQASLIDRRNGDLKGKGLEVLMLELNAYTHQQHDQMVKMLEDWFHAMGVDKFDVAETDANLENTKHIINNFLGN